ncbi:Zinc metalloproteinase-disintegrin-like atrase-A [Halotydeus destructor]|nr:Zinc metalloproteinase-disintegrin-like atrase-A [Halotydeus destructor]
MVNFSVKQEQFAYELKRSDKLFSENYIHNLEAQTADYKLDKSCYYQSQQAGNSAALKVCNSEVSGKVEHKGKTYLIVYGEGQHKLYKASDIVKSQGGSMCSTESDARSQPSSQGPKTKMAQLVDDNREIYIEYVLVFDNDVVKTFTTQATALEFINQALNLVDQLLKELNGMINLVIKDVIFENSTDKIKPGRVIEDQLGNFRDYAIENLYDSGDGYDVAQLVVGRQLPRPGGSDVIRGRAYRGTICSEMALGVVQMISRNKLTHVFALGHAITHEIAHTLGLNHLNYSDPRCPCPGSPCMMADDDQLVDIVWSACTKDDIVDLLSGKSAVDYSCLRNQSEATESTTGSTLVTTVTSAPSTFTTTKETIATSSDEPNTNSHVLKSNSSLCFGLCLIFVIMILVTAIRAGYLWYERCNTTNTV